MYIATRESEETNVSLQWKSLCCGLVDGVDRAPSPRSPRWPLAVAYVGGGHGLCVCNVYRGIRGASPQLVVASAAGGGPKAAI
ncbi:hypothetical protein Dimus_030508 [Dionaea muscipula]